MTYFWPIECFRSDAEARSRSVAVSALLYWNINTGWGQPPCRKPDFHTVRKAKLTTKRGGGEGGRREGGRENENWNPSLGCEYEWRDHLGHPAKLAFQLTPAQPISDCNHMRDCRQELSSWAWLTHRFVLKRYVLEQFITKQ